MTNGNQHAWNKEQRGLGMKSARIRTTAKSSRSTSLPANDHASPNCGCIATYTDRMLTSAQTKTAVTSTNAVADDADADADADAEDDDVDVEVDEDDEVGRVR